MERRLAAILATDMVGYSRLMAADESDTIARQKAYRHDLIDPKIEEHGGRIVKSTGDGLLVEFVSAIDAVRCAVEMQQSIIDRGADVPEERRIRYRMGINLGDVVPDGEDILGDGVNVAARLEAVAEPGGVCISDLVYQAVATRLELGFQDLGEQSLKNIGRKIRAWQWTADGPVPDVGTAAKGDALPLPERPSIAVLPFSNMSRDPEQELFCDGITEDIITALSKIKRLFVVARSSTFVYKDQRVDIRQVGQEQGVRYVLEGSVRRSGGRVRVTAQLIDAETGLHIFAERYDRELSDIFAVQDEITREITAALQIELTDGEQARMWASGTQNFAAWELSFCAAELIDRHVREDTEKARKLLEQALKIDPDYAFAWCKMGWAHWSDGRHHWSRTVTDSLAKAREAANRAHELDPDAAEPFALLAMTALQEGAYDDAERLADEAVERAVGQSFVLAISGMALGHCGRPVDAIGLLEQAMRLCPIYPNWYRVILGRAHYLSGNLDQATDQLRIWRDKDPGVIEPVLLAAALFDSGRRDEARDVCQDILKANPGFTIGEWQRDQSYKDAEVLAHFVDVLEASGVPH